MLIVAVVLSVLALLLALLALWSCNHLDDQLQDTTRRLDALDRDLRG